MLTVGEVPRRSLADYRPIVGDDQIDAIAAAAAPFFGARILHLNATAYGGGVAELLGAVVPLMNDIGLDCQWQVIEGPREFFETTKKLHNGLQGMAVDWTSGNAELWRSVNRENARLLDDSWDFVVVHDAQPAAVLAALAMESGHHPRGRWTWRCHVDLTDARPEIWSFLSPYVRLYDAAVFTMGSYVPAGFSSPRVMVIPPAIDPLSPKNMPVEKVLVRSCLERYGIDPRRPLISQVSRFDPWKDPLGVVDAYRLVKTEVRGLQLAMVASMADDDPEGWEWYERVVAHSADDADIHILTNLDGVGALEVNCLQRASDVVLQKSRREGFGLVVAEALWKERPVVAGKAGGISLQIDNGVEGWLVNSTEECADAVVYYLQHPEERSRSGRAGHRRVADNFLVTRYLRDYLALLSYLGRNEVAAEPLPVSAAV
jgi:trehalose synthase